MTTDTPTDPETSFDDEFSPPTRQQCVEMTVAGLKSGVYGK
ncbi:MAG: hypothetical protein AB8B87_09465 [Granulosicoccus sp.]